MFTLGLFGRKKPEPQIVRGQEVAVIAINRVKNITMKIDLKTLKKAMTTYEIELVEIMSGVAAICWGLWLINPHFATFVGSKGYAAMAVVAPESAWAVLMLVVGYVQVWSVVAHKMKWRKKSSLTLGLLWLFIATMIGISRLASTGVAIYGVFAFFTLWSYLRLSQRVEITSKFNKK